MNDAIRHLEEKIAHLEHHVTAQDKVMLGFAEDLARVRRELVRMSTRLASGTPGADEGDAGGPVDERPPHY